MKDRFVEIKNLNFSVENKAILKDICLSIEKGSFCSIIGPNGSGKTTLLKNISTIYRPKKKKVFIDGKDVDDLTSRELGKNLSLVKQHVDSDFDFNVMDMVLMGRIPHINRFSSEGQKDIEIVEKAMKLTNIFHLKDENIRFLSGGEKQRVIIARSIAQEAKVLLLDEPTSHLDIYYQLEILDTIKRLNKECGITIVAVLHDLNLAAQYSDFMVLVNNGEVAACGRPEEVLRKDILSKVYNVEMIVMENPVNKKALIIPMSMKGVNDREEN
jgi:iron complex transport system ATP-binding protein